MSDTKPRLMWHANGEGRCHAGCEEYRQWNACTCNILLSVPWLFEVGAVELGRPCPFAVLADVLCAAQSHEEPEDRRCGTCTNNHHDECPWCPEETHKDGPPWPDCRFWRQR